MKNLTEYEMEILEILERFESEYHLEELVALKVDVNDVENLIWAYFKFDVDFKDFISTMKSDILTSEQICNVINRPLIYEQCKNKRTSKPDKPRTPQLKT